MLLNTSSNLSSGTRAVFLSASSAKVTSSLCTSSPLSEVAACGFGTVVIVRVTVILKRLLPMISGAVAVADASGLLSFSSAWSDFQMPASFPKKRNSLVSMIRSYMSRNTNHTLQATDTVNRIVVRLMGVFRRLCWTYVSHSRIFCFPVFFSSFHSYG